MTTPIVVTPEMRQAVMDAECLVVGHDLRVDNVTDWSHRSGKVQGPGGPWPAGPMPHLFCARCDHVWIVVAKDGRNYNQAERKFRQRLLASDPESLPSD